MSDRNGYGAGSVYQRGGTWWVQYNFRGKRYRESSESTRKVDANSLLKSRIVEMESGRHIGRCEKDLSVPELCDRYVTNLERHNKVSVPEVKSHLKPVREAFELVLAAAVRPDRIERFIDKRRAAGDADSTINRRLQDFRAALRWGVRQELLKNAPHVALLTEDNVREGFFERVEFEAVEAKLPVPINDIAGFGYLIGWRRGRILPLPWTLVDRKAHEIRPPGYQPNNKKTSIVGYEEGGEIDALIERRWKARRYKRKDGEEAVSEFVFCWPTGHRNAGQRVSPTLRRRGRPPAGPQGRRGA